MSSFRYCRAVWLYIFCISYSKLYWVVVAVEKPIVRLWQAIGRAKNAIVPLCQVTAIYMRQTGKITFRHSTSKISDRHIRIFNSYIRVIDSKDNRSDSKALTGNSLMTGKVFRYYKPNLAKCSIFGWSIVKNADIPFCGLFQKVGWIPGSVLKSGIIQNG